MEIDNNSYAIVVENRKVLIVREKDRSLFGLPGGGIKFGETSRAGLIRELCQELGITIANGDLKPAGTLWGPDGRKKIIKARCFYLKISESQLKPSREIAQCVWINSRNAGKYNLTWILKNKIVPELIRKGIIE